MRGVVGTAAEDYLALGAKIVQLTEPRPLYADGALALEAHAVDLHVGLHREVGTGHCGMQIGDRGAAAPAVALGALVATEAVLLGAVEVLVGRQASLRTGLQEGVGDRV